MRASSRVLLVVAMGTVSAPAGADAVGPPPKECPRGALPRSDHGGPFCHPSTCDSNEDCPGQSDIYPRLETSDYACKNDVKLCVAKDDAGGRGGPYQRDTAFGSCETDADCENEAKCMAARRCVVGETTKPPASLPSAPAGKGTADVEVRDTERKVPTPKQGCGGCRAGSGTDGGWLALLALLALRRR